MPEPSPSPNSTVRRLVASAIPGARAHANLPPAPADLRMALSPEVTSGLQKLADDQGITLFDAVCASLEVLLERYQGLNTPLDSLASKNFRDILRAGPAARISTDASSGTQFRLSVTLEESDKADDAARGGWDLSLLLKHTAAGLEGRWIYDRERFEESAISRLNGHFMTLLNSLLANPGVPASKANLLTENERKQLLIEWNRTGTDYPRNATVHGLFIEQAARTPDAIAAADQNTSITYRELNARSNQLASYLRRIGVKPGSVVAISLDRSVPLVISVLAVLKAGGCYMPLDVAYPPERLRFLIQDANPTILITDQAHKKALEALGARVLALDEESAAIDRESKENLHETAAAGDLAYIMYTSGSTGNPKGVQVLHRGIVRLVRNTNYIAFDASDVVGQIANSSFDAITFELWGALLNGGRLVIVPTEIVLSPERFSGAIREQGITTMFLTASLFNVITARNPRAFATLRNLLVGGDAVAPESARKVLTTSPPARLVNGYGPTECTTFSVCHLIDEVAEGATTVPIGRPISNSEAYILDQHLQPAPVGIEGELYLGGDGLARGYLNRPELTAERFIPHPFDSSKGARLYKTGDKARYREDGVIEFLGRTDHQIKLHGFRIEIGEIEAALRQHPGVEDCVVIVTEGSSDERRLIAYAASSAQPRPSSSDLRAFLGDKLPKFMIPSVFVLLDALPLSAVGKVDRNALPAPQSGWIASAGEAPTTGLQQTIAGIWRDFARIADPGLDDNFFDLGGNSLALAAIEAELRSRFDADFSITDLFRYPTIRSLSNRLARRAEADPPVSDARERAKNQKTALEKLRFRGSRHIPGGAQDASVNL